MTARSWIGISALFLLALGLNVLVWGGTLFSIWVLVPLGVALAAGAVWVVLAVLEALGKTSFEGRAMGGLNAALSSAIFLGICIVLYAFIAAWDVSWDLTQEGRRQLSEQTIQVLRHLDSEVEVTCFFLNVDEELVMIARDKTRRFLDLCQKETALLKVEFLDPVVDRARVEALKGGTTHISRQGTVVMRAGARQKVITLSGGSPRLEERDFTNALINVLRDREPRILFLSGHKERDLYDEDPDNGGSVLLQLLLGESYAVEKLAWKTTSPEVPHDCALLVINNPQSDLHPREIEAIQAYLEGGGRLLLLADPWTRVRGAAAGGEQLRPWLEERYGILLGGDVVVTDQEENPWECVLTTDVRPFEDIDEGFGLYRGSFLIEHPVTRGFDQTMLLPGCRTVRRAEDVPDGMVVLELLRSTPDFWAESDVAQFAQTGQASPGPDEATGPLPLAAAALAPAAKASADGPKDTRLLVAGNARLASNGGLMNSGGNLNFILNAVAWLTEREDLIAIRPSGIEDPPVILSAAEERAVSWVSTLLPLQLVVAAGLAVYLLRRKHQ